MRATSTIWGSILPADRAELARTEVALVEAGIHSHQTAIELLGSEDPASEWQRVQDEEASPAAS